MMRKFIYILTGCFALAFITVYALKQAVIKDPITADASTLRQVTGGEVVGYTNGTGAHVWRGIPYAAPPVNELRWQAPAPVKPWRGTKDVLADGHICPQRASRVTEEAAPDAILGDVVGDEDCLTLNVYAPPAAKKLPVMVWVHGGGNISGLSGNYNGSLLATTQNVVVVTLNYRLGLLGWFSHAALEPLATDNEERRLRTASGNFGTLDIIQALEWVQTNAEQFGGNPDQVTIFGSSSGGFNTLSMMATPLAKGLFHRAIVQSSGFSTMPIDMARNSLEQGGVLNSSGEILTRLLIEDGHTDIASAQQHLIEMDAAEVRDYLYKQSTADLLDVFIKRKGDGYAAPVKAQNIADGYVLKEGGRNAFVDLNTHNAVPIIIGSNRDEEAAYMMLDAKWMEKKFWFLPRIKDQEKYLRSVHYITRSWKILGVDDIARRMKQAGNPDVFAYRFDWDEQSSYMGLDLSVAMGAGHSMELPFVFGGFHGRWDIDYLYADSPGSKNLIDSMMAYWSAFARNGEPGTGNGAEPLWTSWGQGGNNMLILDTPQDQGISMSAEQETPAKLLADIKNDPEISSEEERCNIFLATFGAWGKFNNKPYANFELDGCNAAAQ